MECRFVAIPEAEVQWFHNKKALVESNRIRVENQADMHMYCSIVRISNVSKSDEGTYEVCAKNREGEATNTLILNVPAMAGRLKSLLFGLFKLQDTSPKNQLK